MYDVTGIVAELRVAGREHLQPLLRGRRRRFRFGVDQGPQLARRARAIVGEILRTDQEPVHVGVRSAFLERPRGPGRGLRVILALEVELRNNLDHPGLIGRREPAGGDHRLERARSGRRRRPRRTRRWRACARWRCFRSACDPARLRCRGCARAPRRTSWPGSTARPPAAGVAISGRNASGCAAGVDAGALRERCREATADHDQERRPREDRAKPESWKSD